MLIDNRKDQLIGVGMRLVWFSLFVILAVIEPLFLSRPLVVRIAAPPSPSTTAIFEIDMDHQDVMVNGILVIGGDDYDQFLRLGSVPPRCRLVPEGSGRIDWLEPEEKIEGWDKILSTRPKTNKR